MPGTVPTSAAQQSSNAGANGQLAAAATASRGGQPPDYASQGDANGMVTMQAPDGSKKSVPAADVPHYFALGARRVA